MTAPTEAYPLTWPIGRARTAQRERARFRASLGTALCNLQDEVRKLGGINLIISTNLPLRRDGLPRATSGYIHDVGVAVYFDLRKRPMCFACDRWDKIYDNVQAIVSTVAALRGIERWGSGSMVEQAFTGFTALPAPEQWFHVLGISANSSREQIDDAYRKLAMRHHPDRGGDASDMTRINTARDDGVRGLA